MRADIGRKKCDKSAANVTGTGETILGLIIIGMPILGILAGFCAGVVSYFIGFGFWIPALTCAVLGFGFAALVIRQIEENSIFETFSGIAIGAGIGAGIVSYLIGCGPWISALAGALLLAVYSFCAGFNDFGKNPRQSY